MFVAVDGNIASGKTAFAERLAAELGWLCVRESVEGHPFLTDFYRDPVRYAFETEVTFVLMHRHLLREALEKCGPDGGCVADFCIEKDPLFANLTLSREEHRVFMAVYEYAESGIRSPDILVYLKGAPQTLLERIRRRGRPMEQQISVRYLEDLNAEYERLAGRFPQCKVLTYGIEALDWDVNADGLGRAVREVASVVRGDGDVRGAGEGCGKER